MAQTTKTIILSDEDWNTILKLLKYQQENWEKDWRDRQNSDSRKYANVYAIITQDIWRQLELQKQENQPDEVL